MSEPLYGIDCICDKCKKTFRLTTEFHPSETVANAEIKISSCVSDGVYETHTNCPYCNWRHDLY